MYSQWDKDFLLKRVLPVFTSLLLIISFLFWGSADAPHQSPARPFNIQPVSKVQKAGSDWSSTWFLVRWLPKMLHIADVQFENRLSNADLSKLILDPTRLKLAETTNVRIYFIGEDSGKRNSLGLNFDGIGIREGQATLIFPEASSQQGLHSIAKLSNTWKFLLAFPAKYARSIITRDKPLLPGDFIDLGTVEAGTSLNFFLIGNGAANEGKNAELKEIFTSHAEKNHDKIPHAVALALEGSPYLILSFEDLYGGGDQDYSDCVFAVKMSNYNVAALMDDIDPWYHVKQMIKLGIFLFVFVGIPVGTVLFRLWLRWYRLKKELERARELRSKGAADDVLDVISNVEKKYFAKQIRGEWKELAFDVLEETEDSANLERILEKSGNDDFENREKASLLVSRSLLLNERLGTLGELREKWRDKEDDVDGWKEIEARILNQQERYQEVEMQFTADLQSATTDQAGLMVQVADAVKHNNIEKAQEIIKEAVYKAPDNPEVYLGLGGIYEELQLLEKAGQSYQKALSLSKNDPLIIHDAGEFYRRQTRFDLAIQVWSKALERPTLHALWIKCLFWQKVAVPYPVNWNGLTPPEGYLHPVIKALGLLNENEFWNIDASTLLTESNPALLNRQEIYWLRMLDAIQSGVDEQALILLNTQMFGEKSWNPLLEIVLLRVLSYRSTGFIMPFENDIDISKYRLKKPDLFTAIIQWAQGTFKEEPKSLITLVQSQNIFIQIFEDAGWSQAAKILRQKNTEKT